MEQIIAGVPNKTVVLSTFNTIPRKKISSRISSLSKQRQMPEIEEKTPATKAINASGPGLIGHGTFSHNCNVLACGDYNSDGDYLEHGKEPSNKSTDNEYNKKGVLAMRLANLY